MTADGFPNPFGGPDGTADVEKDCRECGHTIEATVHQIDSQADTWVRCSECDTINRVVAAELEADAEGTDA